MPSGCAQKGQTECWVHFSAPRGAAGRSWTLTGHPYKREHEMLLAQVRELLPTSQGLVLSTPGLVLSNPGLVRNCRRLVKITSCCVRLGQWSGHISLKKTLSFLEMLSLRACIYTYFISPKKYSPVHTMLVFFRFSTVSSVKVLISKCSHGQQSIHTGGERLWRMESVSLHTGKTLEISK